MSGISKVFSTIDSLKRVLSDYVSSPLEFIKRAGAGAREQGVDKPRLSDAEMQEKIKDVAMDFMPGAIGKILFHGGQQAITKVNPELAQNIVKGPGFYLSNILNTPLNFATSGGKRSGVISAFDLPDSAYAKMLRLNDKSISKYPDLEPQIAKLMKDIPALRTAAIDHIKFMREADPTLSPDKIITGEWIDDKLTRMFSRTGVPVVLGNAGIPGKTWQYSHERPADLASVVFPDYSKLLEPIAQLRVEPGIAGAMAANKAMKSILGITK